MTTAFLFAAGRGQRLGAQAAGRPKVFLEIGGRTLLEWHALRLVETGLHRLVIVTGFAREVFAEALPTLRKTSGLEIVELHNPDYLEGSVLSFHVALAELQRSAEPVLLMDADVLYPSAMLRRLVESRHASALLIDRDFSTADDDPVLVPLGDGVPFDFCKGWDGQADALGESIGFFKLDPADLPMMAVETERRSRGPGREDSYDEVLRALVQAGRFGSEDVTGLPWTEIDFPEDLERAKSVVLPAILSGAAGDGLAQRR